MALGAVLVPLYFLSRANYLLFHAVVETFSIVIACGVFMIAWNSRRFQENGFFFCLGVASLFMAAVDFLHVLAYKNMGVFPGAGANLPTQLWIGARYLEALSLLLALFFLRRKPRPVPLFAAYLGATALLLAAVFAGLFPDCFREGSGLTPFKIGSEYLICLLLAGSAGLLHRQRQLFDPGVLRLLLGATGAFILAELSFTLYTDVFGLSNMAGHLFKVAGFYFIYRGVIETGLTRPYDLLFRQLKTSEQRFRGLYQNTPVMLHSIDGQGRLVSVSDYWLQHLGYQRQEVIGRPSTDFLTEESRRYATEKALPEFFRKNACRDVPYQVVKKSGEVIDVSLSAVAERDLQGGMVQSLAVMVDVTEQLQYQQQIEDLNVELQRRALDLEEANAELEAANEELEGANLELELINGQLASANGDLEAFNYSVSHDLRGPLTIISIQCQVILEVFAQKFDPEMRKFVEQIYTQTQRMNDLISTLLDFSRLSKVELKREQVDLSSLARTITGSLALAQPERQATFDISDGLDASGDLKLLKILLENLLGNAWKYTSRAEHARIEMGQVEMQGEAVFFVRDNGVGFDAANRNELFTPFKRLHPEEDFEGFGVGLATVERIASRHGGRVWAESAPGAGATFYFSL
ncbi:PAS domain-containing sensor histidine kinase [Desulfuromonas versatilis]|uniref:histidine kinase n=1 Tax=Desulfuromonas versatilis TaxID=2802975 RepID=A0ABN6DWD1_9BACT|nr:PAS domain-containing sensor histidine kinase [Desulfuromonas versatilis]